MVQFEISKESKPLENKETGVNFQEVDLGSLKDLAKYSTENKAFNLKHQGKVFLKDLLNLTSMEISFNSVPAGLKAPFKHKHKENEEVYIILRGKGIMEIDNVKFNIKEGSVIKVAPKGIRSIDNGNDEELIFIVIQAKDNSLGQFTLTDGEIIH